MFPPGECGTTHQCVANFLFPGGEVGTKLPVQVYKTPRTIGTASIIARIESSDDLMCLANTVDIVRSRGYGNIQCAIPYFPYARQDRQTDPQEAFSLRAFAGLINSLHLNRIYSFDCHSDVTPAIVNNLVNVPHLDLFIETVRDFSNYQAVVSPDAGAAKKVNAVATYTSLPMIVGTKSRDTATGRLSRFEVHENAVPDRVLIVDDICDGGRTFTGLAKILRDKGAKYIGLYVTHGIFSAGLPALSPDIDAIYTTDSRTNAVRSTAGSLKYHVGQTDQLIERIFSQF